MQKDVWVCIVGNAVVVMSNMPRVWIPLVRRKSCLGSLGVPEIGDELGAWFIIKINVLERER